MRQARLRILAVVTASAALAAVLVLARSAPSNPFSRHAVAARAQRGFVPRNRTYGSSGRRIRPSAAGGGLPNWVLLVLGLIGLVLILLMLWVLIRHLRGVAAARRRPRLSAVPLPPVESTLSREQVAGAVADAVGDTLEQGPVADAIIRCWVRVEKALREAGSGRRPSETSTEFVDRILSAHGVRPSSLRALAELYREARFSTHALGEDARARAGAEWEAVRTDLTGLSRAR